MTTRRSSSLAASTGTAADVTQPVEAPPSTEPQQSGAVADVTIDGASRKVDVILSEEDIGFAFARLVLAAADRAPVFAAELARGGASPWSLYGLADNWERWEFEPASFAGTIRDMAAQIEALDRTS